MLKTKAVAGKQLDGARTSASHVLASAGVGCSTAVLLAFGINDDLDPETGSFDWSRSGRQISAALEGRGYRVERLWLFPKASQAPTLAAFLRAHADGDFVLVSTGGEAHSMALRSGRLTDVDLVSGGRRRVNLVYRVLSR